MLTRLIAIFTEGGHATRFRKLDNINSVNEAKVTYRAPSPPLNCFQEFQRYRGKGYLDL